MTLVVNCTVKRVLMNALSVDYACFFHLEHLAKQKIHITFSFSD